MPKLNRLGNDKCITFSEGLIGETVRNFLGADTPYLINRIYSQILKTTTMKDSIIEALMKISGMRVAIVKPSVNNKNVPSVTIALSGNTVSGKSIDVLVNLELLKVSSKVIQDIAKYKVDTKLFALPTDNKDMIYQIGQPVTVFYYEYTKGDKVLNRAGNVVVDKDGKDLVHSGEAGNNMVHISPSTLDAFDLQAKIYLEKSLADAKAGALDNSIVNTVERLHASGKQKVLESYVAIKSGKGLPVAKEE
jgi:hypothetical protein